MAAHNCWVIAFFTCNNIYNNQLFQHGFEYFYPYLYDEISQLKSGINQIKSLEIPEPKGLATIIQGLGVGALLLVALSGATLFLLWLYDSSLANDIKGLHKLFTGLVEAYVIGHGGMGLLHILIAYRGHKTANKSLKLDHFMRRDVSLCYV